jgi:ribonuclease HII
VGWIIGIDEAGYGPNLGPLVMTAVACRLAKGPPSDLWQRLSSAVRRAGEEDDGRVLIADSKIVYSTTRGLLGLERGVLGTIWPMPEDCLATLLDRACPECHAEVRGEPWYRGTHPLPAEAELVEVSGLAERFVQACTVAGIDGWRVQSAIVCPARFNALVDAAGSKGAVLGYALGRLLQGALAGLPADEDLSFQVDKHGGRNTYAAMIQDAVGGAVVVRQESMASSAYEVLGLGRPVHLTFEPRAEAAYFCVALASMASKYLRELLMREFNRFWQEQVPNLKPTAGYPGDAARFLAAIRPSAQKLGIAESILWRRK